MEMEKKELNTKELIELVKKYNPHTEHITLSTIFMKMKVGDDNSFDVVNFGPPGTGKSFSSIELVNELNLGTDIIIDNNVTKRGLFDLLDKYPKHDFILDECTALMRDKGTQDMIKLAMEGKPLRWIKKDSYEETPIFEGNFIMNVNHGLMDSIVDRCFVNKTLMNKRMALDFVNYYLFNKKDSEQLIRYVKKVIRSDKKVDLTQDELKYVADFICKQIENNDENLGYSRRIAIRMISYFRRAKKFFGKLDDEVKAFIEPYASIYIENKRSPTLIETLLGDTKMDKIALIRLLASETGYSERHSRRIVDEELVKGKLQQFGRMVYV